MTALTEFSWDTVPDIDEPSTAAPASAVRQRIVSTLDSSANRRNVIRGLFAATGGLALTIAGGVSGRGQRAAAAAGTEYTNCSVYSYDNAICVGAPYSSSYCGSDKWFLATSMTCFSSGPIKACGPSTGKRNAWRWGSPVYRCADGMQYWCGNTSGTFRICSARL